VDLQQAHQQLKEELGLDHFEGRSWRGLHRHALMTMIAYVCVPSARRSFALPGGPSVSGSADGPHRKIFTGVGPLPTGSSSGQSRRPITTSLEGVMRYLCLVYGSEDSLPVMQNPNPMSRAEVDALTQDSLAYIDMLRTSGHFIVAHALQSVRTATTVRVRGGKVLVTDGAFAETKEQLLGFVLIEAKDHYEAVEVASRNPLARLGSIEVRSIMDLAR
jgi:hypothetical protein